jgi:hypothetical protein
MEAEIVLGKGGWNVMETGVRVSVRVFVIIGGCVSDSDCTLQRSILAYPEKSYCPHPHLIAMLYML